MKIISIYDVNYRSHYCSNGRKTHHYFAPMNELIGKGADK